MSTPTYFRPTNRDTGQPTLAVYFTAPLYPLAHAHLYDLEERTGELVADVRDHLHRAGLPIRPTITRGRVRLAREVVDDSGEALAAEVFATVIVLLTDAEPDDPRLASLAGGFTSTRLDGAPVRFEIPTTESEAELERTITAERERGEALIAADGPVSAVAPRAAVTSGAPAPAGDDVLDQLFG